MIVSNGVSSEVALSEVRLVLSVSGKGSPVSRLEKSRKIAEILANSQFLTVKYKLPLEEGDLSDLQRRIAFWTHLRFEKKRLVKTKNK